MPGRLCGIDFLGGTRTMASGWTSPYLTHHPIFTSAAEAVTALRDGWQRLREAIERADDDQLEVTTAGYTYAAEPPRGGLCVAGPPGPAHPATHFIAGTLTEVGHHGTQIGALRDLYAWRHRPPLTRRLERITALSGSRAFRLQGAKPPELTQRQSAATVASSVSSLICSGDGMSGTSSRNVTRDLSCTSLR